MKTEAQLVSGNELRYFFFDSIQRDHLLSRRRALAVQDCTPETAKPLILGLVKETLPHLQKLKQKVAGMWRGCRACKGTKKDIKYGQFTISWTEFWTDFRNIDHVKHCVEGGATPAARSVAANSNTAEKLPSGAASVTGVR